MQVQSLTLFATHYPLLGQLEMLCPGAAVNYHMSFMQNNVADTCDDAEDTETGVDNITFMYQLARGIAKRSYGLNVARLADVPADILAMASLKSRELEKEVLGRSGLCREELFQFQRLHQALAEPDRHHARKQVQQALATK